MDKLHALVHQHTQKKRQLILQVNVKVQLSNFSDGEFVLVAQKESFGGETCGFVGVLKTLSDYIFRVEDLRTGGYEYIHGTRLNFFCDKHMDEKFIISHVLSSEMKMPVGCMLRLVQKESKLFVNVRCKRSIGVRRPPVIPYVY